MKTIPLSVALRHIVENGASDRETASKAIARLLEMSKDPANGIIDDIHPESHKASDDASAERSGQAAEDKYPLTIPSFLKGGLTRGIGKSLAQVMDTIGERSGQTKFDFSKKYPNLANQVPNASVNSRLKPEGLAENTGAAIPDIAMTAAMPELKAAKGANWARKALTTGANAMAQTTMLGAAKGDSASDIAKDSLISGGVGSTGSSLFSGVKGLARKGVEKIVESGAPDNAKPDLIRKVLSSLLETTPNKEGNTASRFANPNKLKAKEDIASEFKNEGTMHTTDLKDKVKQNPMVPNAEIEDGLEKGIQDAKFAGTDRRYDAKLDRFHPDTIDGADLRSSFNKVMDELAHTERQQQRPWSKTVQNTVDSPIIEKTSNGVDIPFKSVERSRVSGTTSTETAPENLIGLMDALKRADPEILSHRGNSKPEVNFIEFLKRKALNSDPIAEDMYNKRELADQAKELMDNLIKQNKPNPKGMAISLARGASALDAKNAMYGTTALMSGMPLTVGRQTHKWSNEAIERLLPGFMKAFSIAPRRFNNDKEN